MRNDDCRCPGCGQCEASEKLAEATAKVNAYEEVLAAIGTALDEMTESLQKVLEISRKNLGAYSNDRTQS